MKKKVILTILVTCVLLPGFINGAIPTSERAALIALFNSTNGDGWRINSGWKTPPLHTDGFATPGTEGSWYGVTASGDKVTGLTLRTNNLHGDIPSQLENLTNLQKLDLGWNYLSGSIPSQLSNLSNLQVLDLVGNSLGGSILPQLGNLSNLKFLNLARNSLSGGIPSELANLSNLKLLNLAGNQLRGGIPPQLGNLINLQTLDLGGNDLSSSIPYQLSDLSNLEVLDMAANSLSGSIPPELSNLSNLKNLNLEGNKLEGSIPSQLSNLNKLKFLWLAGNKLSGNIPPEFGNLSQLLTLDLGENQLGGSIPPELGKLNSLTNLALKKNQLSGSIPSELGNLSNLTYLSLYYNRLSGNIPSQLGNLSNLCSLLLSNNQLNGSIPPELCNLNNLQELSLAGNQLSGNIPPGLEKLSSLTLLALGKNQLSGGIPLELGKLSSLTILSLGKNQLSGIIPPELGKLNQLEELYLSENQLSGRIPSELGNLSNLIYFFLNNNHLEGEIPSNLSHLMNLSFIDVSYNCLSASDPALNAWLDIHNPGWELYQNQCGKPEIALNRTKLNFGEYDPTIALPGHTVSISNSGKGVLNWNVSADVSWIAFSPSSGTGSGTFSVIVISQGKSEGVYTGILEITDPNASNSPQTIPVTMHVYEKGKTSVPFGEFATPLDNATVSGSIPVTGWALDDIRVANVKIYNSDTYIGDAMLLEGARPDVEAAYPTYPYNYMAGWGYMLLTNSLPNGGNGNYSLIAKATDMEGNEVTLGSKTITCDNAHAVKPFGAIDTPPAGETISGKNFINYGWALTPQPNVIPVDGSAIDVVIDGVVKGHPVYNIFRSDVAALFPGYANTDGAGGYFSIDTTNLKNGLHTIAWIVSDSGGNSDGIGSRYFTVQDFNKSFDQTFLKVWPPAGINSRRGAPPCAPIFDPCATTFDSYSSTVNEIKMVEIQELERVEINLSDKEVAPQAISIEGYLVVGDQLRDLPIGSTLDTNRGIFYWQPGPGFVGEYHLMFLGKDDRGQHIKKNILINIMPMDKK